MKKFLFFLIFSVLLFYFACWQLPAAQPVKIQPLPPNSTTLLLPLDSRPVCTEMAKELGSLAGTTVILPPKGFLDNYQQPAAREKLYLWLHDNLSGKNNAIISSDLLIHGGLINSRLPLGQMEDQRYFLSEMQQLQTAHPNTQVSVFSIIPRLLVSDHLLPDRWYQWHLMQYARLKDMTETFNDPQLTLELLEIENKIPQDILKKYTSLYSNNDRFNKYLLTLPLSNIYTVIGQDDGSSFGLPNRNTNHARMYAAGRSGHITYGADEIAAVLIARNYLQQQHYVPAIYLQYAAPEMEFLYMPFMAASVGETLRDKIALAGAKLTEDKNLADIILYINCGNDNFQPHKKQVQELQQLLNDYKHVALVDLSANYTEDELLMPLLLRHNVPLNKLSAYAGWNTFSNSAGTAIAQAVIFAGRCQQLPPEQQPALYAANLTFTAERLLDDYVYQKLFCPELKKTLEMHDYDSYNLSPDGQYLAQMLTQQYMNRKTAELLHYNLGRTPFYSTAEKDYYLTELTAAVYMPWNRVFEIGLDVNTAFGIQNKK